MALGLWDIDLVVADIQPNDVNPLADISAVAVESSRCVFSTYFSSAQV
jgi:hypothetical protein